VAHAVSPCLAPLLRGLPRRGRTTAAEEAAYFARIRGADPADAMAARGDLAVRCAPRVEWAARKFGMTLDPTDAFHAGMVGMLTAIDRYRPVPDADFFSHALPWVKDAILRARGDDMLIRLPGHRRPWRRARPDGVAAEFREAVRRATAPAVRTGPDDAGDIFDFAALPGRDPGPVAALVAREDTDRLRGWLDRLGPRHRRVIELRYGLGGGRPLDAGRVGAALGLPAGQAARVEADALACLRALAAGREPEPAVPGRDDDADRLAALWAALPDAVPAKVANEFFKQTGRMIRSEVAAAHRPDRT
jgi:RNA polymerase sigma factor (sigma-70 family)